MLLGVIARLAPAEVPVQSDRVQQCLKPVVRTAHLRRERRRRVMAEGQLLIRGTEPVRLVVGDRVPRSVEPRDQVDAAGEKAADA